MNADRRVVACLSDWRADRRTAGPGREVRTAIRCSGARGHRAGVRPGAPRRDSLQLNTLFEKQAPPLFQAVFDGDRELVDQQIETGHVAYINAVAELGWRLVAGIALALAGLSAVAVLGWTLLPRCAAARANSRRISPPSFDGDLTADISRPAAREFHQVTAMLRAMRAHLAFASWERAEFERKSVGRQARDRGPHGADDRTGSRRCGGEGGGPTPA